VKNKTNAMGKLIGVLKANDMPYENKTIKDLHFVLTCASCPEQYDVFDAEGNQVGYVRFRWGHLTCEYPDCGGEVVYETNFDDGWQGCFVSDDDRRLFLEEIANAIHRRMAKAECVPFKQVRCINDLKNGVFGIWFEGTQYDVVRYDEEDEEWYIKDECGDTGIVDTEEFNKHFKRIED
jgi:hypothetical protein